MVLISFNPNMSLNNPPHFWWQNITKPIGGFNNNETMVRLKYLACGYDVALPAQLRFQPSAHMFKVISFAILFLLSVVGNSVLFVVLSRSLLRKSDRVQRLLWHMNIADLIITLYHIPKELIHTVTIKFYGPIWLCKICKYMDVFGVYLGSNILVVITLDRFCCIMFDSVYLQQANRRVNQAIIASWITASVLSLPQLHLFTMTTHPCYRAFSQCIARSFFDRSTPVWMDLFNTVITSFEVYILPFIVICICYAFMFIKISRNSEGIADFDSEISHVRDEDGDQLPASSPPQISSYNTNHRQLLSTKYHHQTHHLDHGPCSTAGTAVVIVRRSTSNPGDSSSSSWTAVTATAARRRRKRERKGGKPCATARRLAAVRRLSHQKNSSSPQSESSESPIIGIHGQATTTGPTTKTTIISERRRAATTPEVTTAINPHPQMISRKWSSITEKHPKRTTKRTENQKGQNFHMTAAMVILFLVCWTPYFISAFLHFLDLNFETGKPLGNIKIPPTISTILNILATINSCANPYLYGYFSIKLRREVRRVMNNMMSEPSHLASGIIINIAKAHSIAATAQPNNNQNQHQHNLPTSKSADDGYGSIQELPVVHQRVGRGKSADDCRQRMHLLHHSSTTSDVAVDVTNNNNKQRRRRAAVSSSFFRSQTTIGAVHDCSIQQPTTNCCSDSTNNNFDVVDTIHNNKKNGDDSVGSLIVTSSGGVLHQPAVENGSEIIANEFALDFDEDHSSTSDESL